MRVIATGGGTGGHVYPALSILAALKGRLAEDGEGLETLYVGSNGGLEEGIVRRAGLPFRAVAAGAVLGRSPVKVAGSLASTFAGAGQALAIVRGFRPRVVLATGGYVCVPVVFAAWLLRVPSLIFLPDMAPGLAVRTLARIASRIAVSFAEASRYLPAGKTVATGYPVRPELFGGARAEARRALGLNSDLPVVLVLGGSRGARSINNAVHAALPELLRVCQVLHVAGESEEVRLRNAAAGLAPDAQGRYRLYAYLHSELPSALAAADVVVSRAGASVMGEYPAAGLPSILIPYPHAGAHQRLNAAQLASHGAAVMLDDESLPSGTLGRAVTELLTDTARLARMRQAASNLARPQAGRAIAELILELAGRRSTARAEG